MHELQQLIEQELAGCGVVEICHHIQHPPLAKYILTGLSTVDVNSLS